MFFAFKLSRSLTECVRRSVRQNVRRSLTFYCISATYLPEQLVGDIRIADTRVVSHDFLSDQIGSDFRFFSCNVNWRTRRSDQKIFMHDQKAASINGEAPDNNEMNTRNSSGDEIANVNFLYDDIVHALKMQ